MFINIKYSSEIVTSPIYTFTIVFYCVIISYLFIHRPTGGVVIHVKYIDKHLHLLTTTFLCVICHLLNVLLINAKEQGVGAPFLPLEELQD